MVAPRVWRWGSATGLDAIGGVESCRCRGESPWGPSHNRQLKMEPLWSPVVATGGNRSRMRLPSEPQKQAVSVADGCERLPKEAHGKEGVDRSSPSEGS